MPADTTFPRQHPYTLKTYFGHAFFVLLTLLRTIILALLTTINLAAACVTHNAAAEDSDAYTYVTSF